MSLFFKLYMVLKFKNDITMILKLHMTYIFDN